MSSSRQTLTIVGQVVGAYFGGSYGAAIGGAIGGYIGGNIDGPQKGPRLDDTSAPQIEFGGKAPRVYGRVWCTLTPLWWTGLRRSTVNSGGKGAAADETVDNYIYHCDMLGRLADGANVIAWTRIRIDGKIVASQLANSSAETLAASANTDRWADVELRTGAPDQAPWSVMEAVEGEGNVSAYRDQCTIAFTNFLMTNGRNPSFVEVEVITSGTSSSVGGPAGLLCNFDAAGTVPLSAASHIGPDVVGSAGTSLVSGAGVIAAGESFGVGGSINGTLGSCWRIEAKAKRSQNGGNIFTLSDSHGRRVTIRAMPAGDVTGTNGFQAEVVSLNAGQSGIPDSGVTVENGLGVDHYYAAQWNGYELWFYLDGTYVGTFGSEPDDWDGVSFTSYATGGFGFAGSIGFIAFNPDLNPDFLYTTLGYSPVDPVEPWGDEASTVYAPVTVDLKDVLEAEMLRCAPLTADDIDMSAAAGKEVWGFKAVRSAAAECAVLLDWYYLDIFCGDKITVVERGGAIEQTIPYGYTGSAVDGTSDPFSGLIRGADVESQFSTAVQYINILADGEVDTQQGQRVGTGSEVRAVNFSIYSKATEAKGRAETITHDTRVAAHTATVRLGARHAAFIQPASVLRLVDNKGNSYRVRVLRLIWNRGVYDLDVCLDDPNILKLVGIATEDDTSVIEVAPPAETEILLLDGPIYRNVDNDPGFYAFAKGAPHGSLLFDGDNVEAADFSSESVFGTCSTTLGNWTGGAIFDEVNTVTVNVGSGQLSSATRAAVLADQAVNICAIGAHGRWEVCQFRTASLTAPGVYVLSGLLRGLRGTEHAIPLHEAGDQFVRITTAGRRVEDQTNEIGVEESYTGVTKGRSLGSGTTQEFTNNAVGLKPFSPVYLRTTVVDGGTQVSWEPRTRFATNFASPLGIFFESSETTQSFDVDLFDPSDALVSTETVTSPTWSASGVASLGSFTYSARDIKIVGGDAIGIDILSEQASSTGQVHFCQFDATTGALILISAAAMGASCEQWTSIGDEIYAATTAFYAISGSLRASHVHRLTRGVMNIEATFDATYSPGTADGYISGIAADGTDVWITEYFSGTLRKLHPTTLASVATYALGSGISEIQYDSGSLWIVNRDTHEMIEWDIATTSEVNRFDLNNPGGPTKVLGGLLFNFGGPIGGGVGGALYVYNKTTGALVNTIDNLSGRGSIVEFGGEIVCQANGPTLYFIDAATGLQTRAVDASDLGYYANADGSDGTSLYVTTYAISGSLLGTYIVDLDAADLTGYSVTVYQIGQSGRGYPATLEL